MGKSLLMVAACVLSVSCGTFRNFHNDTNVENLPYREPYGGVRIDVILGVDMFTDESCGHGGWEGCVLRRVFVGPYLLSFDLVASALADTITLPATSSTEATEARGEGP